MSSLPVNGARGEVALRIGSVDLVLAAEMGRWAAVSTALNCMSLQEFYTRVLGVEPAAVLACLRHLTIRGDVGVAISGMYFDDYAACKDAFSILLNQFSRPDSGKAAAAPGAAAKS